MSPYREVHFTDSLLADGSAHRRFSDGREEWRWRGPGAIARWRDSQGRSGTDEPLGGRIIKRQVDGGPVQYGRDQGYGRTAWSDGVLTVNRTSFGGRMGAILAAVGAGALLGTIIAPPVSLTLAEEEELRRQAAQQQSSSSGNGGGDGGGGEGSDDWDDDAGGSDDDFG